MTKETVLPTDKFRLGTVCVTEWTNKSDDKVPKGKEWKNYSIQASYFDEKTKDFKESKSFSEAQLYKLLILIQEALKTDVKRT